MHVRQRRALRVAVLPPALDARRRTADQRDRQVVVKCVLLSLMPVP
jgi:hypothetical protein